MKFIQAGNDGPVVGVEVKDIAGGKTLNIRTRRAVVIGAGGWKANARCVPTGTRVWTRTSAPAARRTS